MIGADTVFSSLMSMAKGAFKHYRIARGGTKMVEGEKVYKTLKESVDESKEAWKNIHTSRWGEEGSVTEAIDHRTTDHNGDPKYGPVHKNVVLAEEHAQGAVTAGAEATGAALGTALGSAERIVTGSVRGVKTGVNKLVDSSPETLKEFGRKAREGIKEGAAYVGNKTVDSVQHAAGFTGEFLGGAAADIVNEGGDIVNETAQWLWDRRNHALMRYGIYGAAAVIAGLQFEDGMKGSELKMKLQNTEQSMNSGNTYLSDNFAPGKIPYNRIHNYPDELLGDKSEQNQPVEDFNATGDIVHALHLLRHGG